MNIYFEFQEWGGRLGRSKTWLLEPERGFNELTLKLDVLEED